MLVNGKGVTYIQPIDITDDPDGEEVNFFSVMGVRPRFLKFVPLKDGSCEMNFSNLGV